MATMTATEAKNRFGEVLDIARKEPVRVQKNGRDVAVVLSADDYAQLVDRASTPKVRPQIERLLSKSIEKRASLYKALAR